MLPEIMSHGLLFFSIFSLYLFFWHLKLSKSITASPQLLFIYWRILLSVLQIGALWPRKEFSSAGLRAVFWRTFGNKAGCGDPRLQSGLAQRAVPVDSSAGGGLPQCGRTRQGGHHRYLSNVLRISHSLICILQPLELLRQRQTELPLFQFSRVLFMKRFRINWLKYTVWAQDVISIQNRQTNTTGSHLSKQEQNFCLIVS